MYVYIYICLHIYSTVFFDEYLTLLKKADEEEKVFYENIIKEIDGLRYAYKIIYISHCYCILLYFLGLLTISLNCIAKTNTSYAHTQMYIMLYPISILN